MVERLSALLAGRLYPPRNTPDTCFCCGPDSSVGIATDYGLDGPGSNPGGEEIFLPSRPALGPNQPPVQWVPGLSRGRAADHSPPSCAAVMEEQGCTSTDPLGHIGPVTGSLSFLQC